MRKKLLAFALAAAMALSCVGCSDTAASGGSMVSTGGTSGSATSTATDEPITLTLMDQFVEGEGMTEAFRVPFPVSWTVKMKKKQKETQDILSYHTQAAGCSDKARAKASGGRQPIEECGRTGL